MQKRIYFDGAANITPYKEVLKYIKKYYLKGYNNPSSLHKEGLKSDFAMDWARNKIAEILRCKSNEIFFVSSSSEAIAWVAKMRKLVVHPVSHHSVLEAKNDCSPKLTDEFVICIPLMNSETGNIMDLEQYGDSEIFLDLTASIGKKEFYLDENPNVKYACFSAHKFGGILGAGVLFIREDVQSYIQPLIYGFQENNYRGGTENFPAIVAMAKALEISSKNFFKNKKKMKNLCNYLLENINGLKVKSNNLNVINITFKELDAQTAVSLFDKYGIAISAGSACNSLSVEPSKTLLHYGYTKDEALKTIRISLTSKNKIRECKKFIKVLNIIIDSYDN